MYFEVEDLRKASVFNSARVDSPPRFNGRFSATTSTAHQTTNVEKLCGRQSLQRKFVQTPRHRRWMYFAHPASPSKAVLSCGPSCIPIEIAMNRALYCIEPGRLGHTSEFRCPPKRTSMDFDKVLSLVREMNRERVDYIVFGALALNIHGIVRATTDADFFVKADRDNIERLKRALRNIWSDPHIDEISAEDLLGEYPSITYGPPEESFAIDLLTRLGEVYTFDDLPSEIIEIEGVPVRVVTAAKLYEMKRDTVRL